ncbi:MAG: MvaI/BcnI restriction endonuclease family protein [Sneathiella sp.]|nr:MvaI/BcnI restriction endonuclease family protein [Sneathiella sp.]
MSEELNEIRNLEQLKAQMKRHGVATLLFKRLSPNDNSKNQIYLGGDYAALQILPFDTVTVDHNRKDSKRDRFKARLDFHWLDGSGETYAAPNAQLILYPKYPEVRMSGFLIKTKKAPRRHLASRDMGRTLLLGITKNRKLIGHVIGADNPVSHALEKFDSEKVINEVFSESTDKSSRDELLERMKTIHEMGWIDSQKLNKEGVLQPYRAQNGGGYTLEALFGITPNGDNEPDFKGWELKQHSNRLRSPILGGPVTLMTPEPNGGFYQIRGVREFVKTFGYPDTKGKANRMNFGGIHKVGLLQSRTGLTLTLKGFDPISGKITDVDGGLILLSENGVEAAIWHFDSLLEKWNRKHERAVYVSSDKQKAGKNGIQYRYGSTVALCTGTDFNLLLNSLAARAVYYDPGIKVENIGSPNESDKRRSQFRVKPKDIPELYHTLELVELT